MRNSRMPVVEAMTLKQVGSFGAAPTSPTIPSWRAPYVWVIDTDNDRVVLLRVE